MKILFVSLNHTPEQTGIGKYQGEMSEWLASRGHKLHAITAPPYYPEWKIRTGYSGCRYKREEIGGVTVYRVPIYVPSVPSCLKRLIHILSFVASSKLVILWQALYWRPDVIVLTAPPLLAAPVVLFAGFISGARTQLHVQDFEVDAAFNLGMLNKPWLLKTALWVERALLRSFDEVSTISRRMREKLINKGVDEKRAFLIPNWAGVHDFDPAQGSGYWPDRLKTDTQTILAVYSGNLGRKQGLETIVDAARLLKDKPHIRVIISGDGAGRKDMEDRANGLNNVVFLPVQPKMDFIHLMIAADIHLLPQKAEAADIVMPSKLGNILASGKPVVVGAESNTQLYDAVQGCGIAVPPDNAAEFAKAIITLADNVSLRAEMGKKGRERALMEWSKESILKKMEDLLLANNFKS